MYTITAVAPRIDDGGRFAVFSLVRGAFAAAVFGALAVRGAGFLAGLDEARHFSGHSRRVHMEKKIIVARSTNNDWFFLNFSLVFRKTPKVSNLTRVT